jgi:O-antigen ligase
MQRIETLKTDDLLRFLGISLFLLLGIFSSRLLIQNPPVLALCSTGFFALVLVFVFNIKAGITILIFLSPLLYLIPDSATLFPESPYSINLMGLLNLFIPFLSLCYLLTHKQDKVTSSLSKPILIFLGILFLSVFASYDSWISLRHWFRLAMPISVYFLVLQSFQTEEQINRLKEVLLLSSIVPLSMGIYQIFYGIPESSELYAIYKRVDLNRIIGSFPHPNWYAAYLVILIPLVISFYSENRKAVNKLFYLILLGGMLISLFCTYTRVAWAAFLASLTILGTARFKRIYVSLILVLLTLFLLIPSLNQAFLKRIQLDSSFYGRFSLNQLSFYLFSQKPVLGQGLGTYQLFSAEAFGKSLPTYGREMGVGSHNDYLRFLSETGMTGFLAYLFLLYSLLKLGHTIFKNKTSTLKSEGSILLAILSGFLIYSLTDSGFLYGGIYLWSLIGIIEGKYRLNCTKARDKSFSLKRG